MPRGKRRALGSQSQTQEQGDAAVTRASASPGHLSPSELSEWNWTIGIVAAPFGRFGELRVKYETDFPERFGALERICLRPPAARDRREPRLFEVKRSRPHKGHVLLKLIGIESIDDAQAWRGASVQVPRDSAVPLPEGAYYTADIEGLDVVTIDGRCLGKLDRVLHYPGQDLLQMGEILIPAVKEFVVEVDVPGGRIVVAPPEGLLPGEAPEVVDAD